MSSTPLLTEEHRSAFDFLCQAPRRPGSEHSRNVREWIKARFQANGFEASFFEERFVGWAEAEPAVVRFTEPEAFQAECYTAIWSPSTNGIVKGRLEPAGEMLTYETYSWKRYVVRDDSGRDVLFLLTQPKICSWVQTLDDSNERIPHVTIDAYDKIEEWLAQGKSITVEAEVQSILEEDTPLVSVCGSKSASSSVCITAHYDSVHNGVGAHDNASGVVALMDIAKEASALPENVQLISFDGEEMNKIGAYRYVDALRKQGTLDDLRLVVNIDSVGIGEKLYVLVSPELEEQVRSALSDFEVDVTARQAFKQFDSWPFMKERVPVVQIGAIFSDREKVFPYFNAVKDTLGGNGFDLNSRLISEASEIAMRLTEICD